MNKLKVLVSVMLAVCFGTAFADNSSISAQMVGNTNVTVGSAGIVGHYTGAAGTNGWVGNTSSNVNGSVQGNVSGWQGFVGGGANGNAAATVSPHSATSSSSASSGGAVIVTNGGGMVNTSANAGAGAQSRPFWFY